MMAESELASLIDALNGSKNLLLFSFVAGRDFFFALLA